MNKHLKLAFFIAPILALVSYALTGYFSPSKEIKAGNYQLQLISQCKPIDSSCLLKHADFELKLISKQKQDKLQLAVVANQELDALSLALSEDNTSFKQFKIMKSDNKKYWQVFLEKDQYIDNYKYLRLASQSQKSKFFIETEIQF